MGEPTAIGHMAVLFPDKLANELRPASKRLSTKEEADSNWSAVRSSFGDMQLSCSFDYGAMDADSYESFGRHSNTLAPHSTGPAGQTGYQSWGQYENKQWETSKQKVTDITLEHLPSILACFRSLACVPVTLYRPRGQHIAHCDTTEHNDRQRGNTFSLFRFLAPLKAALLIRLDVFFYVSLVAYRGIALLPI